MNSLYYGDNLDILRKKIKSETVDLCYIDPPFNSKRNYNQIYNNVGDEDRAQAQPLIDRWSWDAPANSGQSKILANSKGGFSLDWWSWLRGFTRYSRKEASWH